jgi:peroxiredoxin
MSRDGSGNEAVSPDQTFTTNSAVPVSTEVGAEIGMRAPDFTLPTLDGKQISLSDFRGKIVMINFWQDVQQSRNELSVIQDTYVSLPRDEVAVLAISWKQTLAITQSVATSKGLTMPVLLDDNGDVAAKYSITNSPITLFIDGQGIVRNRSTYPATFKTVAQIQSIINSIQ